MIGNHSPRTTGVYTFEQNATQFAEDDLQRQTMMAAHAVTGVQRISQAPKEPHEFSIQTVSHPHTRAISTGLALIEAGYDVTFTPKPEKGGLVSMMADLREVAPLAHYEPVSPSSIAYARLFDLVGGVKKSYGIIQSEAEEDVSSQIFDALGNTKQDLLRRSFMTSTLAVQLPDNARGRSPHTLALLEEVRPTYDSLAEEGYTPFTHADLGNIALLALDNPAQ